jgi:hypothetical protein
MADTYNIQIDAGATYRLQVSHVDDNDVAINLTGYTARMHVRETVTSASTVIALTSSSGITITPSTGTLDIVIAKTVTKDLVGPYVYDLEIESGAGVVDRLLQGSVTVNPEVTRE